MTIPKAIAQQHAIEAGAEIERLPAGDAIRAVPPGSRGDSADRARKFELFDEATERQQARQRESGKTPVTDRGWRRVDLYDRGFTR